eukprot:3333778-Pyramimonas_sp.AAC.1
MARLRIEVLVVLVHDVAALLVCLSPFARLCKARAVFAPCMWRELAHAKVRVIPILVPHIQEGRVGARLNACSSTPAFEMIKELRYSRAHKSANRKREDVGSRVLDETGYLVVIIEMKIVDVWVDLELRDVILWVELFSERLA